MVTRHGWAAALGALCAMVVTSRGYAAYTYTTLDNPLASGGNTQAFGVLGSTVVGSYYDGTIHHGFSETDGVYTPLDYPTITYKTPAALYGTFLTGISGNTSVGYYSDDTGNHGFTETGGVFTVLDDPHGFGGIRT